MGWVAEGVGVLSMMTGFGKSDSFIPFWRSHYTVIHMLARGGRCDLDC
jgi:hypothetical protein